ncbi:MAG: sensor histidine kinase [Anaerolineaceae bacterium]|nr:sensor histidine kinase [Anaerolineaceae bacterium]
MKKSSLPVISLWRAAWFLGLLLAVHLSLVFLVNDEQLQTTLSGSVLWVEKLLAGAALFYAARFTTKNKPNYASSWYFWMAAILCSVLGDITWTILQTVLNKPPFPSVADIFYLMFYVLTGLGLAKYPAEEFQIGERKFVLLDDIIVVMGAGLSFWYLIIGPMLLSPGQDILATLLALIYPVLDIILLWSVLIFFRRRSGQSAYIPILMIGLGSLIAISSDVLFAFATIHNAVISGISMDLGWGASSITIALAGILQVQSLFINKTSSKNQSQVIRSHFLSTWPVYLPYLWLAIAYGVLLASLRIDDQYWLLYVMVGLIIGLVIFRQVLTLNDNAHLYQEAQQELYNRKQAQDALYHANLVLDARVEQRTNDLRAANDLLVQYNQKIEGSLHEKEVLLKEIHHRVKNNLQIVSSLLNMQARAIIDPEARTALQNSQARVRSMALIHERLYQSQSLGHVNFGLYIKDMAAFLFRTYQDQSGQVQLKTYLEEVDLDIDTAVPLGLVLNELITNSLKYAFPGERAGEISIQLLHQPDGFVTLVCTDNGIGLKPDQDLYKGKSLGMELVSNLTQQIDGQIEIESQDGLKVRIIIPDKTELIPAEGVESNSTTEGIRL